MLIFANVTAAKLLQIGPFVVPGSVIVFPLCLVAGSFINHYYGRAVAQRESWWVISFSLVASILFLVADWLPVPTASEQMDQAFHQILGMNYRMAIAGVLAFVSARSTLEAVFYVMRNAPALLRQVVLTLASTLVNSIVFTGVAYAGSISILDYLQIVGSLWLMMSLVMLLQGVLLAPLLRGEPFDKQAANETEVQRV